MAKDNSDFHSKAALDAECERYSDEIFALFETYRDGKSKPWLNGHYYPALCATVLHSSDDYQVLKKSSNSRTMEPGDG